MIAMISLRFALRKRLVAVNGRKKMIRFMAMTLPRFLTQVFNLVMFCEFPIPAALAKGGQERYR